MATCSEHSGAPRLQGLGRGGACAHRPFPGVPLSPAPGVGLLWGKARPGTSPVQLASSPCGVCPQPEGDFVQLGSWRVSLKIDPHPGLSGSWAERACKQDTPQSLGHQD